MVWHTTGNQNSYLVKRKTGGGVQFSRDPYNLTNKHSRKVCTTKLICRFCGYWGYIWLTGCE